MLSFEEKKQIIARFTALEEKEVSLGRVNYHYPESKREKSILIKHLHPNGNGYVYAPYLDSDTLDKQGYFNIYNAKEFELVELIEAAISYMDSDGDIFEEGQKFTYQSDSGETLELIYENKMWIVYAAGNVEAVFKTLEAAESYLADEGFFVEN
ncbi:hypothetical protein [Listeria fleischmannii]|jgi:hypothetical protein|uniref:Uncharacterized protein n=1 Tax=Listeria fleischmannii FSL S10-1203 TaxID=1265822 RepID=W7DTM3_9LIST|nr:hypothetical protein [Listeria fleischmannii]EUJ50907.1 hypothetical protein MCOL2_15837 [Listeria fleischmannii FSL S10-1203]MBC1419269.1 hypothetical protein [Listeria fleischmannii]